MTVEFYRHSLGSEEKQKVMECLDGVFLTTGQYVKDFERLFAEYFKVRHAVGVNSCTAALHLALLALDIGHGDEVITTPMTFIATANAIVYTGATPVFVDVERATGLMDVGKIEKAVTGRTKAIIPVHLYGQMCDMKALAVLASKHKLKVVEDCAHSVESMRDGIRPGTVSDAACFSFYATKNLTCGEGGAVITNDPKLADRILVLRQHGMSKGAADRYGAVYTHWDMVELGWKYNLSNIQAAMLLPQIAKIEEKWLLRDQLYHKYVAALSTVPGVVIPESLPGQKNAYHLFTIQVPAGQRDSLLEWLNSRGIGCAVNYRAVHLLEYYRKNHGFRPGRFPVAEAIGDTTVSLPFWPGLTDDQLSRVVSCVRDFMAASFRQ